jgi:energy-coupling factor transport system ATP-binding protein
MLLRKGWRIIMSYIEIKELNYIYPEETLPALKDINLEIDDGEIVLLCGSSGSGKSTLAKCICGTIPRFYGGTIGGSISICGKKIETLSHREMAGEITLVFQDPERQLVMSKVHREIAYGLENIGVEGKIIKRRVWESLQFANLLDLAYRDINTLSGGEKQKVAIASALAYMPKCIILDEPTSQLDPSSSEEVMGLARKINSELGVTIIVIEQRINKWFDISDRLIIMKDGKIAFSGDNSSIYNEKNQYINEFTPAYIKFMKHIGIQKAPCSFKESRKLVESLAKNNCLIKKKRIKPQNAINGSEESEISISIKNLHFSYDNDEILKGINLIVHKGEFIGLLGANGAGKSTLLKCIMGLENFKGSIKLINDEFEANNRNIRSVAKNIGYVSQNPEDYISKDTVYDELKFTLDNYQIKDYERIDEILNILEINSYRNKNPRDLSGGEKQRVAIASVLVLNPKVLLLDEPTRGLDDMVKKKLGLLLQKLNESGTTIIMVTHDTEFAAQFCRRYMLMFNGDIIFDGSGDELFGCGIYYSTQINKLFRSVDRNIFTLKDALESYELLACEAKDD